MEITKSLDNETLTFTLVGRLDTTTAPEFDREIKRVEVPNVVLDFSNLDYISSSGLRCILTLYKSTKSLVIMHPNDTIYEVLDMTGFIDFIDCVR